MNRGGPAVTALWKHQPGCCAEAGGEGEGGTEEAEGNSTGSRLERLMLVWGVSREEGGE